MKRTAFVICLLLSSILIHSLQERKPFVVFIPFGNSTIPMTFHAGRVPYEEWTAAVGSQAYKQPAVNPKIEGELVIPDSITFGSYTMPVCWISRGAFQSCPRLTKIHLPSYIYTISDLAFEGCTMLREITIPDSVWAIYPRAFIGCTALRRVEFCTPKPPMSYNNDTFDEVTYATATLVIPAQSSEVYLHDPISYRFRYHAEVLPLYSGKEP